MLEREKLVNVFAGIGVLATALLTTLGVGVATGRLRVSITRPKKEVEVVSAESKLDQVA